MARSSFPAVFSWLSSAIPCHKTSGIAAVLLVLHTILLSAQAWHDSPTFDEVGHLAAGIRCWDSGRFDLYLVNPPLVRLVATAPLLCSDATVDVSASPTEESDRPEFSIGASLFQRAGLAGVWWMTVARLSCIPFAVVGACTCFLWARDLYGRKSGLLAMMLWCFSPSILAHGHLITPDAPAAAVGASAIYCFWKWLRLPNWKLSVFCGLLLGMAELTKATWIVLYAFYPLAWIAWRLSERWRQKMDSADLRTSAASPSRKLKTNAPIIDAGGTTTNIIVTRASVSATALQLVTILLLSLHVLNLGYGYEDSFKPLGTFRFVSDLLGGGKEDLINFENGFRNRFTRNWLGDVPVPLPANYILGVDLQRSDFEKQMPSYLRGEWRDGGWWIYYIYALAIKEPVGTWLLFALSIGLALFGRARKPPLPPLGMLAAGRPSPVDGEEAVTGGYAASWRNELFLLAPAVVVLALVSSQTGFNHHVRYVLPCLPFLFISMSKVARCVELRQWKIAMIAGGLLVWSVGSSLYYYPHSLSYFNEMAGGPRNGHFYLGNSNVDWGQDLIYLKSWCEKHPEARPLHLAYDNWTIDPKLAGGVDSIPVPGGPVMNRPGAPTSRDWPWLTQSLRANPIREIATPLKVLADDRTAGPQPGWFIVSVNQIHRREGDLEYFLEFDPVDTIGYTMNVYHITFDDANRVRRKMGLSELVAP
jgi:hypothetical protein